MQSAAVFADTICHLTQAEADHATERRTHASAATSKSQYSRTPVSEENKAFEHLVQMTVSALYEGENRYPAPVKVLNLWEDNVSQSLGHQTYELSYTIEQGQVNGPKETFNFNFVQILIEYWGIFINPSRLAHSQKSKMASMGASDSTGPEPHWSRKVRAAHFSRDHSTLSGETPITKPQTIKSVDKMEPAI